MCKARNVELYSSKHYEMRMQEERHPTAQHLRQRQENLVRKLALSLPVHLLAKTEENVSLPEVLGYQDRNKAMLTQEQRQSRTLTADNDGRFITLEGTLTKAR